MSDVERPGAEQWVPERLSLKALRTAAQECRGCELYQDATQAVMGDGPRTAPLMVVGEQPGDKEDLAGEPFVGPAGKLLDRALGEAGIDPESVFRTNVVKHFRFAGTRGKQRIHKSPSRVHVAACGPWLVAELALVKPQGVVLLGGTAGQAVYGSKFRVGKTRGRLQEWPAETPVVHQGLPWAPDWVLPTTHPSAVLRSRQRDEDLAALVADLKVAADALG
ncbi:MAG TPA: UdgX family uracil-DNA binding protein [Nocardioidaceae bacterium]|nr:UdgX family uracil-DNA binding protein [Nocardioidaceae bacterium]